MMKPIDSSYLKNAYMYPLQQMLLVSEWIH